MPEQKNELHTRTTHQMDRKRLLRSAFSGFLCVILIGGFSKASAKEELGVKAQTLGFGEIQIRKMLKDRPAMTKYVAPGDLIWKITVRYFEGKTCNHLVLWNNEIPDASYYIGCHRIPISEQDECYIQLRQKDEQGRNINGELLWSCLIFEFNNLACRDDFYKLHKKALEGKLSREQWIRKNTELEYQAISPTVRFYKYFWTPEMRKRNLVSKPEYWMCGYKETYDDWIAQYRNKNDYPYTTWGRSFDSTIVPYLEKKRKYDEAMRRYKKGAAAN